MKRRVTPIALAGGFFDGFRNNKATDSNSRQQAIIVNAIQEKHKSCAFRAVCASERASAETMDHPCNHADIFVGCAHLVARVGFVSFGGARAYHNLNVCMDRDDAKRQSHNHMKPQL